MSLFEVAVRKIDDIQVHPNADKLELAVIGGYRAVVKKGEFTPGQLALYVPTDAVVPDDIAHGLGIKSYLVGKYKNRVKAVRLRGQVSQGIVIPLEILKNQINKMISDNRLVEEWFGPASFDESKDFAGLLHIEKYEEPIPIEMAGHVRPWPSYLDHYDVENVNHPDCIHIFQDGEEVVVTEKLHGTNMAISIGPGLKTDEGEHVFVCSRRMALKDAEYNLYWMAARKYGLIDKIKEIEYVISSAGASNFPHTEVTIRGEVVGIQDLKYGYTKENPGFYAFDIRIDGEYLTPNDFISWCEQYDIPHVPVVYHGPYNYDKLKSLANGMSQISPDTILEGVVVKPVVERRNDVIGRVVLKFISEEYLTRSEGTELH